MSHRGAQAAREDAWARAERRDGYADGKLGRKYGLGNEHYLRGHREGTARRKAVKSMSRCGTLIRNRIFPQLKAPCPYLASREYFDVDYSGEWQSVCGIHAGVAQRRGMLTRRRST